MHKGWIGVDLDGTLAYYEGWSGGDIGQPIPAMVERVKRWIVEGREVRIFTARVSNPEGMFAREMEVRTARLAIQCWCEFHIGTRLEITCLKDSDMIELWDDRAVSVEANTGRQLAPSRRGLE